MLIEQVETRRPMSEEARLAALRALDVLDSEPDDDIDTIVLLAADRFNAPIVVVSLVDDARQWFAGKVGLAACETTRDISFCTHAIAMPGVFVVPDATRDPRFADNPLVLGDPHIRFYAGAPLITTSGAAVGALAVIDTVPRDGFDARSQRVLALMAQYVITHIEMRRMRRAERIAHLIGATTSDAFIGIDLDNRIIHWNRGATAIFGWDEADAMGRSLSMIVPERMRRAHEEGMQRLQRGGTPRMIGRPIEIAGLHRDGHELTVELSLGMWHDEGATLPAGFAAVIRDATARRQVEAEREATSRRLAEQIAAIQASSDGIAITDSHGCFTFMNGAFAEMFGFANRLDPLGQSWTILYAPEEAERLREVALPRIGDRGPTCERERGRWRGEAVGRRLDGSAVVQEISLSLGSEGGIVWVTRDITARQRAEREQARLREQLLMAQRQEAVGQLAAGIAHDFNNLIAVMSGSATLIAERHDDPQLRRLTDRIIAASTTAASLVSRMLDLGARQTERQRIDFRSVVLGAAELVRPSLSDGQRLIVRAPEAALHADADPTELMQVALNLLVNARDALPEHRKGTIELELRRMLAAPAEPVVGVRCPGPVVRIRVRDTGSGIEQSDLSRIFSPYFSNKGAKGTGLGLAVVSRIVGDAGGCIDVASELGVGTVFDIYWPLGDDDDRGFAVGAPVEVEAAPPFVDLPPLGTTNPVPSPGPAAATPAKGALGSATAAARPLAGLTILVVDDHVSIVEAVTELLERAGAEVGGCSSPRAALEAIEDDPAAWNLLITDYDMPGMTGAELAMAVRRVSPEMPIVLCSGLLATLRIGAAEQLLFDAMVAKPIAAEAIYHAATTAIARRRTSQA